MERSDMRNLALIIDDSPVTCAVLEDRLVDLGYEVQIERNVGDAMGALVDRDVHLVFLDMLMPETPGWTIAVVIRDYCSRRGIPMLFISAIDQVILARLASDYGASAWLSKPFDEEELAVALVEAERVADRCRDEGEGAADGTRKSTDGRVSGNLEMAA